MDRQERTEELKRLIEDYLQAAGLELVEFICRQEAGDMAIKVLVDKPAGGISMDECAGLNRRLGELLDETDASGRGCILEVSSPGLDRPLKHAGDFRRCIGRKAVFYLNGELDGRLEWEGSIKSVGDDFVVVLTAQKELPIPFMKINKAKQLLPSN